MTRQLVELREATLDDVPVLARLMHAEFPGGKLRELGPRFLTLLNRAFCRSRHAVCIVATVNGCVVGYVAGVVHLGRFYREFLLRHGAAAVIAVLPNLFGRHRLATLLTGLSYWNDPRRDGPQSELLVLAVSREFSGQGIGRSMLDAVMDRLRAAGVGGVRLGTVAAGNEGAMSLYSNYGFQRVDTHDICGDARVHVMEYRFRRVDA